MFAGSGHFRKLPCPYNPGCHRKEYCIFSHVLPPSRPRKIQKITQPVNQKPNTTVTKRPEDLIPAKTSNPIKRPRLASDLATIQTKPENKPVKEKSSVILVSNIDVRNVAIKDASKVLEIHFLRLMLYKFSYPPLAHPTRS
ncbi:RNA exonuclease 3 [Basidiobolus ranarum]|uniref:RNA exonuclease 3 n=1 Tax=Basidiobolus ranarum TaxID=34480 RepID=A0ABR2WX98_9FUNG